MADEISDPEARGVAERAHKTLLRVGAEGEATAPKPAAKTVHSTILRMMRPSLLLRGMYACFCQYR